MSSGSSHGQPSQTAVMDALALREPFFEVLEQLFPQSIRLAILISVSNNTASRGIDECKDLVYPSYRQVSAEFVPSEGFCQQFNLLVVYCSLLREISYLSS